MSAAGVSSSTLKEENATNMAFTLNGVKATSQVFAVKKISTKLT